MTIPSIRTEGFNETELAVPADPGRTSREIARVWERFVSSGELAGGALRPVIADSWQRCRQLGVDPLLERAPTVVLPGEIDDILASDDFGQAGREVLDEFGRVVEGTGHVILLADHHGRIVYSVGHRGMQGLLDRLNLAPGGGWAESAVGSNGIGTPIALGRPEIVFGPEHYGQHWQPWVCYGCPVRDPSTGHIRGVVDITGPAKRAERMTFGLTVSIARSIEQHLVVLELRRRQALSATFRGLERRWPGEGLLAVDGSGTVVEMNPAAASALGIRTLAVPDPLLAELAPELVSPVQRAIEGGGVREERLAVRGAGGERPVLCRVEPVRVEGRALGSVVILSPRGPTPGRDRGGPTAPGPRYSFQDILGDASRFREALALARVAARRFEHKPILLVGESGTGKELVAHAIHLESPRARGRFVAVNCGALPRDLVESELFGYAPGAFTGARREGHAGKFQAAHGGTLFLDEVDSLPLDLQGKFLRVVEGGEVVRLGSETPLAVDVRIVAACSEDLRPLVEEGRFRLDLFHRLGVVEIVLPPLRERPDDIRLLAGAFLAQECAAAGRGPLALAPRVVDCLVGYRWPGNVRELRNLCTRWALTVERVQVEMDDVPRHIREPAPADLVPAEPGGSLRQTGDAIIRQTLAATGGDVAEAARRLGVARTTIYRRLKQSNGG
jgi:transcriptional regulator of acetoin/glycerol metabolism